MSECDKCRYFNPSGMLSGPEGCVEECECNHKRFREVRASDEDCPHFKPHGLTASTCSDCEGAIVKGSVCRNVAKRLRYDLHLAKGTADLAIKHRDEAESVIERIRALVTQDHESKEAFIQRVKACLPSDPFSECHQNTKGQGA